MGTTLKACPENCGKKYSITPPLPTKTKGYGTTFHYVHIKINERNATKHTHTHSFYTKSRSSFWTVSTEASFPENFLERNDTTSFSQSFFVAT